MSDSQSSERMQSKWWNDDDNAGLTPFLEEKLAELASHAVRQEQRLAQLDARLYCQNKMQRIEFALQNTDKFSFRINHHSYQVCMVSLDDSRSTNVTELHSPKLVERILYELRTGERARIKFTHIAAPLQAFKEAVDAFRESLVNQLHRLTGTKPYVEWSFVEATANLKIWYSKEDLPTNT